MVFSCKLSESLFDFLVRGCLRNPECTIIIFKIHISTRRFYAELCPWWSEASVYSRPAAINIKNCTCDVAGGVRCKKYCWPNHFPGFCPSSEGALFRVGAIPGFVVTNLCGEWCFDYAWSDSVNSDSSISPFGCYAFG